VVLGTRGPGGRRCPTGARPRGPGRPPASGHRCTPGRGDEVERSAGVTVRPPPGAAYQLLPAYYHTLLKRPNIYFERESELFAR